MFHRHNYVESSTDKNVIYCTICGKIKVIPCNHQWEILERFTSKNVYSERIVGYKFIKKCNKCNKHDIEVVELN